MHTKVRSWLSVALLAAPLGVGCATGGKVPNSELTSSKAAVRTAEELGADKVPAAAFHLKLAKAHLARAEQLISEGETQRARFVLAKASSDADLSIALAKEEPARQEAYEVQSQAKQRELELNEGGEP
jgi:hypothetical protein